jgi:L-iditol 2-dehydrogenase
MKAAYLSGIMKIDVLETPIPPVPPGGMLVKVVSTGLCGSDLNRIRFTSATEPRVIGHEIAGDVAAVDESVTQFKVGDRVAIGHVHVPCMHCVYCRHGSPAMCRQFKETKVVPGGYAEYVAVSPDHIAHTIIKIPEHVSYAAATFVDPLACCIRALDTAGIRPFDRVVIVGAGIMGLLFVQLLRELQAESWVFDISDYRLEMAKAFGANHVFNSKEGNTPDKVLSLTNGEGADIVLVTFITQATLDDAMQYVRDGGKLCVFAPPNKDPEYKLDFFSFFRRELKMFSTYSFFLEHLEMSMLYIATKKIDVESMITGTTNLEGMLSAVAAMDDRQIKLIVSP